MSDEPNGHLPAATPREPSSPRQTELEAHRAEITHPDGTRETVELRAEQFWQGALPRPRDFAKYGEVVPDAPERLLRMAEKEQEHRIAMERIIVPANTNAGRRGQWLGASISLAALILAVMAVWIGAPWQVAVALVGVPVLSVARSLVTALRSDDK